MLSSVSAWHWLIHDCVNHVAAVVRELEGGCLHEPRYGGWAHGSGEWLTKLVHEIYRAVTARSQVTVNAGDYLPLPLDNSCPSFMISSEGKSGVTIAEAVCTRAVNILRTWLSFPSNTDLLSAYYVIHVLHTFHLEASVLLLHGVWKTYRTIKTSILDCRKKKASSLRINDLDPFVANLRSLPLADPLSPEARKLRDISAALKQCDSTLHEETQTFVEIVLHGGPPTPPSFVERALPQRHHAKGSQSAVVPRSTSQEERGLRSLLSYLEDVAALAHGACPKQLTPLQAFLMKDLDRFSPLREDAPSRAHIRGSHGPYAQLQQGQPGSFPSCAIFRGLTFHSRALTLSNGYYTDFAAWQAFLRVHGFDKDDVNSRDFFFNQKAYGNPQVDRRDRGHIFAQVYFGKEDEYVQLRQYHGVQPVPFAAFLKWMHARVGWIHPETGEHHAGGRFPILGGLTAFLLAGDLYYAGIVERPTCAEVAHVVHKNKKGSFKGLITSNQISGMNASVEEVVAGFIRVYEFLDQRLAPVVKSAIGFDEIALEHILCKYNKGHALIHT